MKKLILLAMVLGLLVSGCNNVKDLKFTKDNQSKVMEKIGKSKGLTGEEIGLLTVALSRYSFSKESLEGKTVGQIIQEQRKIMAEVEVRERETKRLADEAKKKETETALLLAKYINVAPYKKGFQKADIYSGNYNDYIVITFIFENRGDKNIKAFKGKTVFNDLFGTHVYTVHLMYDEGLKIGQKKQWIGWIKYNQFREEQSHFKNSDLEKMKVDWIPTAIIFEDGTKIGIEE